MFSVSPTNSAYRIARTLAWCLSAAVLLHGGVAAAAGDEPWKVAGKLMGKPKSFDGLDSEKSQNVSGIACATTSGFPRICLLADDETQGAQIVTLHNDTLIAGDFIRLIYHAHDGELIELDAEGVGYAAGAFYVMGSHGRARHERQNPRQEAKNAAKADASRQFFRVRFDLHAVSDDGRLTGAVAITPSAALPTFIQAEPALAPTFNTALVDNGLTIEGVAVRDGVLYAGMRGPVRENGDAILLAVPLAALFSGKQGEARPYFLHLGTDTMRHARGVRDLVAFENGFLVLAGPVQDPPNGEIKDGDYAVFWWDGTSTPKKLKNLPTYGKESKPEALVPLARKDKKLGVLLLFDGPAEGTPRAVDIDQP